jgi:hypothetical protein
VCAEMVGYDSSSREHWCSGSWVHGVRQMGRWVVVPAPSNKKIGISCLVNYTSMHVQTWVDRVRLDCPKVGSSSSQETSLSFRLTEILRSRRSVGRQEPRSTRTQL